MLKSKFDRITDKFKAENGLLKFCFVCITICFLWMGFSVRSAVTHQRTILVPVGLDSKVSITDGYASPDYIRKFARDISTLAFSYTPSTVRGQYGELLLYFAPAAFTSAKKTFYELADSVEKAKITSLFVINKPVEIDAVKMKLVISGALKQWADTTPQPVEEKIYQVDYQLFEGRFQVTSISEMKLNKDVHIKKEEGVIAINPQLKPSTNK